MAAFDKITTIPTILNGQPTIRGMRLTVRRVIEALADLAELGRPAPRIPGGAGTGGYPPGARVRRAEPGRKRAAALTPRETPAARPGVAAFSRRLCWQQAGWDVIHVSDIGMSRARRSVKSCTGAGPRELGSASRSTRISTPCSPPAENTALP